MIALSSVVVVFLVCCCDWSESLGKFSELGDGRAQQRVAMLTAKERVVESRVLKSSTPDGPLRAHEKQLGLVTVGDVAVSSRAVHVFGDNVSKSLKWHAFIDGLAVQRHAGSVRRSEIGVHEPVVLLPLENWFAVLQNASAADSKGVRASNAFRLHNQVLLPLFYALSRLPRALRRLPLAVLPLREAAWFETMLVHAPKQHPVRKHLHDSRVSSIARVVKQLPATPQSVLLRDQLHRFLLGVRSLRPVERTSVFARAMSVERAVAEHTVLVDAIRWGVGPTWFAPSGTERRGSREWVRQYKEFVWQMYELDTATRHIERPIWMRDEREGDPLDMKPSGHKLDDDVHVVFGWKEYSAANETSDGDASDAYEQQLQQQQASKSQCVGCDSAFVGTDGWCRCCSLNCGGFKQVCVEQNGFCKQYCLSTKWCTRDPLKHDRELQIARASQRNLLSIEEEEEEEENDDDEQVSTILAPRITLIASADRALHFAPQTVLELKKIAKMSGFTMNLCCRTIIDHKELVRLLFNTDVLIGFGAGGSTVNALYLREDTLLVELPSPEEEFADSIDADVGATMAADLRIRYLRFRTFPIAKKTGLVYNEKALHKLVNQIKTKTSTLFGGK